MPRKESKFGAVTYYPGSAGAGHETALGGHPTVDAQALARELRERLRGEVRFDAGSRALYASDGSIYRQVPIGVVVPRDVEDVIAAVELARQYGAPVLPRGGGTSLEGQCVNVALVLDFSKYMHEVIDIDPERRRGRVQAGTICDTLRKQAEVYRLTLAPDPATHNHCTVGGMVGNGSCGPHSIMGGKTEDNVDELDILLYDGTRMTVGRTSDDELEQIIQAGGRRGEIYARLRALRDKYADLIRARYPDIPRRVSGYNLNELLPENGFHVARALVGSEGTCATVLEATMRLVYSPPVRPLVVLGYPDPYTMADHVPEILEYGPIALEGFDAKLTAGMAKKDMHAQFLQQLPPGGGWLLVEFGADTKEEADERARRFLDGFGRKSGAPHIKFLDDPGQIHQVWRIRESAVGAVSAVPGEPLVWPAWEDAAAPPDRLGDYLRDSRKLLDRYGYEAAFYGHFGQGCVHRRMDFGLKTAKEIERFRAFMYEAAELVVSYGGSLSGEHGDGQAHAELLPIMFGPELVEAFREFKAIWDPASKMNPGKLVDAYRMDQNLRFGITYDPPQEKTYFAFPYDHFTFTHGTERCVGVGRCRRIEGEGTMCPSFMVTREEKHSTRGRARLLWEMMQGEVIDGWKSEAVKESLDLCLACKGCKGDCPVRVDMATYKAEFLAHYYEGRLRPMSAYSMGLIYYWSRLAAHMPRLVNLMARTPGIADVMKRVGGIAPQRKMPAFAPQTFKAWFRQRAPRNEGRPVVMLWPDTFNNHFHPETAQAAVEVLEAAGYQVVLPDPEHTAQTLCCGRPLYDYGMLNLARRHLRQILDRLEPAIQHGIPVVVLEPSCATVFRDELLEMFPNDEDANRLARQTYLLSEFLDSFADYTPPRLPRKALVHGHCHHKAVLGMGPETRLLDGMELDYTVLDDSCCGMAGSFGFEPGEKYEVSVASGERVLLPAVRKADDKTLIVTDGFSCREQISDLTDREALHISQVLQMALHEGTATQPSPFPEREYAGGGSSRNGKSVLSAGALGALSGVGALALGSLLVWRLLGRRARGD